MRICASIVLAAALAATASAAGGNQAATELKVHPTRSVALPFSYDYVVADGAQAAAVRDCGIELWSVAKRKPAPIDPCLFLSNYDDSGLESVALANGRLAWIRTESKSHGTYIRTDLVVKEPGRSARQIGNGYSNGGFGGQFEDVSGTGNLLAASYYFDLNGAQDHLFRIALSQSEAGAQACPHESTTAAKLCVEIPLPQSIAVRVVAVSQGRMLVLTDDGIYLVGPGTAVEHAPIPTAEGDLVALSGKEAILVHPGGITLDIYDVLSGAFLRELTITRVATRPAGIVAAGGFALLYSHGPQLIRLDTGKETALLGPDGKRPLATTLTKSGLFVLYRPKPKQHERLGFVPIKALG